VSDFSERKLPLPAGGAAIPALGFGTLIPDPVVTRNAVTTALQVGFRHLDCAERYRNERQVGEAIRAALESGVLLRRDLFVTTKLWNNNHRPERVGPALRASLERLGLDSVDLYLIHTPFAFQPGDEQEPRDANGKLIYDSGVTLTETWQALEEQVDAGACKAIGLSDAGIAELSEVLEVARIRPAVAQVESHPYLPQWELLEFCRQHGIVLLAFAALGHSVAPRVLDDPSVVEIAGRLGRTPAQVVLAWAVQRGTALLTTSKTPSRIRENFDLSPIPDDAMEQLNGISTRHRFNQVVDTGLPGFIPQESRT
jgi:diketogulonate reductase-like aldo/keto reductase